MIAVYVTILAQVIPPSPAPTHTEYCLLFSPLTAHHSYSIFSDVKWEWSIWDSDGRIQD